MWTKGVVTQNYPEKFEVTHSDLSYSENWMWPRVTRVTQNDSKRLRLFIRSPSPSCKTVLSLRTKLSCYKLDELLDDWIQPNWTVEKISEQGRAFPLLKLFPLHYWFSDPLILYLPFCGNDVYKPALWGCNSRKEMWGDAMLELNWSSCCNHERRKKYRKTVAKQEKQLQRSPQKKMLWSTMFFIAC